MNLVEKETAIFTCNLQARPRIAKICPAIGLQLVLSNRDQILIQEDRF